ncbi:MAG: pore-forming ESAT-6 family protein [Anaerorhabdus sp.]
MEEIRISLAEVSSTASTIRSINEKMYDNLITVKKEMNNLSAAWISEGGEAIRQRFNTFATRFESQKELIDRYSAFLDLAVSSYDSLENTIVSNASSVQT